MTHRCFPNGLLTRRKALRLGLGALVGAKGVAYTGACAQRQNLFSTKNAPIRNFPVNEDTSLKELAAAKGLVYGAAGLLRDFDSNSRLIDTFVKECSILTPEWSFKWAAGNSLLRPSPTSFDFTAPDRIVEISEANNLLLRGHTLVWHSSLPDWFMSEANRYNAEHLMTNHIQRVVGRYAGKIYSWDVVNEAIEPDDGRNNKLRNSPWLEFLGTDYIDLAFRVASESNPQALLVYNDYDLYPDTPKGEAKRAGVLSLLEHLVAQGTPIHALGVQSHLKGDDLSFNPNKMRSFLADIASLGLKILITELDVNDRYLPADIEVRDRIVASIYEDYLSAVLDEQAVISVQTWGLIDSQSWLQSFLPRFDGLPLRPLPLDSNFNRKLAWNAIARSFNQCPERIYE